MFLDLILRRNPTLVEQAIALHQTGALPANCYVIDLDAVERNARRHRARGRAAWPEDLRDDQADGPQRLVLPRGREGRHSRRRRGRHGMRARLPPRGHDASATSATSCRFRALRPTRRRRWRRITGPSSPPKKAQEASDGEPRARARAADARPHRRARRYVLSGPRGRFRGGRCRRGRRRDRRDARACASPASPRFRLSSSMPRAAR